MKPKKYIKLKVDMYEDTKFKIIDTMENRDTINYIWTRILALCGKINNEEGNLVLSKNIVYTTEILALEFNRTQEQVENAIKVFIDLNMMDKDERGMLSVVNWGKYQGKARCKNEKVELKEVSKINIKNNKDTNEIEAVLEESNNIKESSKDNENKLKETNNDSNCSTGQIIDFIGDNKDCSKGKDKRKSYKGRKKKIDKIVDVDENESETELDLSGVDIDISNCGRVVSSFDMSYS